MLQPNLRSGGDLLVYTIFWFGQAISLPIQKCEKSVSMSILPELKTILKCFAQNDHKLSQAKTTMRNENVVGNDLTKGFYGFGVVDGNPLWSPLFDLKGKL